jgi:hypothetical protein
MFEGYVSCCGIIGTSDYVAGYILLAPILITEFINLIIKSKDRYDQFLNSPRLDNIFMLKLINAYKDIHQIEHFPDFSATLANIREDNLTNDDKQLLQSVLNINMGEKYN